MESRNDALVRFNGSVRFAPGENIYDLNRTFFRKDSARGVADGRSNGISTLVEHVDMRCPRARRVQTESAEKTETIQNLRTPGKLRHGLIIHLLIEIHPGLVAGDRIGFKLQAVQIH